MANEFELQGLEQALRRLRQFPDKLQKKGLSAAVRKGANLVAKAARQNAKRIDNPQTAENIARNISSQSSARLGRKNGGIAIRVGVKGGARQYGNTKENVRKGRVGQSYATLGDKSNPGGDTWYWRFVELGTSRTRAQPFLLPALENNQVAATAAVANELERQIDKLVATEL
jgi:HK97 gp10 family phage protein